MLRRNVSPRFAAEWKRLSPRERLVLSLLFYEGLTPLEAARALGCTLREVLRTVETRLEHLGAALDEPATPRSRRSSAMSNRRMAA